jgi:hypothetical protein
VLFGEAVTTHNLRLVRCTKCGEIWTALKVIGQILPDVSFNNERIRLPAKDVETALVLEGKVMEGDCFRCAFDMRHAVVRREKQD